MSNTSFEDSLWDKIKELEAECELLKEYISKNECMPFDAYYKTCEVVNGQLMEENAALIAENTRLHKCLSLKDRLLTEYRAALEYIENSDVCFYELAGGDGAPSGYFPYPGNWEKARAVLSKHDKKSK